MWLSKCNIYKGVLQVGGTQAEPDPARSPIYLLAWTTLSRSPFVGKPIK